MRIRALGRVAVALAAGGALTAGTLVLTAGDGAAATNYGPGAKYQVEISANTSPTTFTAARTGNFWVWAALYPATATPTSMTGTTDYQEIDCIHLNAVHVPAHAAAHVTGSGTWHVAPNPAMATAPYLYLTTVTIIGGAETATIAVPMPTRGTYGHTHGMTLKVTALNVTPTPNLPPVGITITYPSQNQIAR